MKKTIAGLIAICTMSAVAITPVTADSTAPSIIIDGITIHSDVDPYIVDGTTLVPLRAISEHMGATVEWDAETRKIHIQKGLKYIDLTIGEYLAYTNGGVVTTSKAPCISDGRTMVPLRFIGEALNCSVDWDGETRTINITTTSTTTTETVQQEAVDQYGRAVSSTNLPSNASDFPYIAEEIPNWCYELQATIMKNNYWGPAYYVDTGLKGDTAASVMESNSDLFPQGLSGGVYETVQNFVDLQTNIDYNIISDSWVNSILNCISDTSVKSELEEYLNSCKELNLVTSGEAKVMPEGMWIDTAQKPHVPVYIKYTVNSVADTTTSNFTCGGSLITIDSTESLQAEQTYEAVVTYTLEKDPDGVWKIDWDSCNLDVQINPLIDATDGVKTSSKNANRQNSFVYSWSKVAVGRYDKASESTIADDYDLFLGL